MKNSVSWLVFIIAAVGFIPGCLGYKLGSSLPGDIQTIYVATFINGCNEPLIEVEATNATIAEFQKDGTLRIARTGHADVILECTLNNITLAPIRFDRSDKTEPNEWRLTLGASFVLKRTGTFEIIGKDAVTGETTFSYGGSFVTAKKSAIPEASADLAKRIVEKVVEIW